MYRVNRNCILNALHCSSAGENTVYTNVSTSTNSNVQNYVATDI